MRSDYRAAGTVAYGGPESCNKASDSLWWKQGKTYHIQWKLKHNLAIWRLAWFGIYTEISWIKGVLSELGFIVIDSINVYIKLLEDAATRKQFLHKNTCSGSISKIQ